MDVRTAHPVAEARLKFPPIDRQPMTPPSLLPSSQTECTESFAGGPAYQPATFSPSLTRPANSAASRLICVSKERSQ